MKNRLLKTSVKQKSPLNVALVNNEKLATNDRQAIHNQAQTTETTNNNLLQELREVAIEHSDRITFVYLDGNRHEDQMKSLG